MVDRELLESGLYLIPDYMHEGVRNYFYHRIKPGGFMMSLLSGESVLEVLARADDENTAAIKNWCVFLYNYVPSNSYGTQEKVWSWLYEGSDTR